MPSFDIPTSKIAPGSLPGPRITPDHVAPVKGIANATNTIQKVAGRYIAWDRKGRDQFDENRITEVLTNSRRRVTDAMIGGDNPLYFRKGSNAFGSAGEGGTRMDQIRDEAMESLTSQKQKDEFMRRWPRVSEPWTQRLLTNESRQGDVYTESVFKEEEEWIVRGDSPPEQAGADARILAEKRARFRGEGSDRYVTTETQKIIEARHLEKFNQLFISGRPIEALDYFERFENEFGKEGRKYVAKNKEKLFQESGKQAVRERAKQASKEGKSGGEEARIKANEIVNDNSKPRARDYYRMPDGTNVDFIKPAEKWDLNRSAIMRQFKVDDSTLIYAFVNSGENPGFGDLDDPNGAVNSVAKAINNHAMVFKENPHLTIAAVRYGEDAVKAALEAAGSWDWEKVVDHLPEGAGSFVAEILNTATLRENVDPQAQAAREKGAAEEAARQARITAAAEINTTTRLFRERLAAVKGDLMTDVPKFKAMDQDELRERYEEEIGPDGVDLLLEEQRLLYKDQNYAMAERTITDTFEAAAYFRPTKEEVLKGVGEKTENDRKTYDNIKFSILEEVKATVAKNNGRPMSESEIKSLTEEKLIKNRQYVEKGIFTDTIHNLSEVDIMRGLNNRMQMRPATPKEMESAKAALRRVGEELTLDNLADEVESERNYQRSRGVPQ